MPLDEYEVTIDNSQGMWRYVVISLTHSMAIAKAKDRAREDGWNGYDLGIKVKRL